MHRNNNAIDGDWAQLVRAEFLEIPGLNVTRDEAQRLWGLDREACEQLLAALVERRFLNAPVREPAGKEEIAAVTTAGPVPLTAGAFAGTNFEVR